MVCSPGSQLPPFSETPPRPLHSRHAIVSFAVCFPQRLSFGVSPCAGLCFYDAPPPTRTACILRLNSDDHTQGGEGTRGLAAICRPGHRVGALRDHDETQSDPALAIYYRSNAMPDWQASARGRSPATPLRSEIALSNRSPSSPGPLFPAAGNLQYNHGKYSRHLEPN